MGKPSIDQGLFVEVGVGVEVKVGVAVNVGVRVPAVPEVVGVGVPVASAAKCLVASLYIWEVITPAGMASRDCQAVTASFVSLRFS